MTVTNSYCDLLICAKHWSIAENNIPVRCLGPHNRVSSWPFGPSQAQNRPILGLSGLISVVGIRLWTDHGVINLLPLRGVHVRAEVRGLAGGVGPSRNFFGFFVKK